MMEVIPGTRVNAPPERVNIVRPRVFQTGEQVIGLPKRVSSNRPLVTNQERVYTS